MNLSPELFAAKGHQIALLQMSCRLLRETLDCPFSLWFNAGDHFVPSDEAGTEFDWIGNENGGQTVPVASDGAIGADPTAGSTVSAVVAARADVVAAPQAEAELALGEQIALAVKQDVVSCLEWTAGRCLVVVTAETDTASTAAVVGLVKTTDRTLLERLVHSVLKQTEQARELQDTQVHLNEFADQVTNDFEELNWLRSLTEHIEVCDLRNDLATVSEAILPPLRELIDAEAVVLFTPATPVPVDACPLLEKTSFVAGDPPISLSACRDLIERSRSDVRDRPLVRNTAALARMGGDNGDLRNYILVRISRSGKHYGWLLVTNRRIVDTVGGSDPVNASCLQEWEFGTFEAGLLNAASIMLGTHARNAELFGDKEQLLVGVMRALINAIDAKDAYTCGHSDRVALFANKIAQAMNLSAAECQRVYMAGLLHDIGKIGVPDEVLCKPGKLTDEEFEQIKAHPEIGYSILKHVKQLEYVLPGVLHHHESIDGSGYPHHLKGDSIPLHGRILAVADAYDAMTSTRSYRKAMPTEKAEGIIHEGRGTQWDPIVVDAFLDIIEEIREARQQEDADGPPVQAGAADSHLGPSALEAIYQAVNAMAYA